MSSLQRMGGVAALVEAATFVVGFAVFLAVLLPAGYLEADLDPSQKAAILADNQTIVSISYLTSYVVFGIFLVVLALALYERLKAAAFATAQTATAFALIWAGLVIASGMTANIGIGRVVDLYGSNPAQAGSAWVALDFVVNGLGGEMEIVGGLWVLLISWAALRAGGLPKAVNYLGVVIGVSGLLTMVGALRVLGPVFGLGLVVWFTWLGITMLRSSQGLAS